MIKNDYLLNDDTPSQQYDKGCQLNTEKRKIAPTF